jgi:hypothetical protein
MTGSAPRSDPRPSTAQFFAPAPPAEDGEARENRFGPTWRVYTNSLAGLVYLPAGLLASLGGFVYILVHLPARFLARCGLLLLRLPAGLLASLGGFVYILVHLPARFLARCGLLRSGLLLRRCSESDRASGNDSDRED